MADIKFNLTVDSMFDLCEVLEAIGIESIAEEFDKEDLKAFQTEVLFQDYFQIHWSVPMHLNA